MTSGDHYIQNYLDEVRSQYQSGQAREHAYRPALQALMSAFNDVKAVNDPKRSMHGSPDFIFLKESNKQTILGYAEAKDVDVDLDKIENSEQMRRYAGYDNLILTNYLEFRFFKNGEKYQTIRAGEHKNHGIVPLPANFTHLEAELQNFFEQTPEHIKSGKRLALIMGGKALRIRENVRQYLSHQEDERSKERNKELEKIYQMMRELLVHDLSTDAFADMYAQTLVYGLFVARYNDEQPDTFSRSEARDLVPKSNPFLQRFFDHIIGPDFDPRLGYIVDELCDAFRVSDVKALVHKHLRIADDQDSGDKDPIIHFYEDFLKEYDPAQRKQMGAYYTPVPVVRFIVNRVDEILQREFGLSQGLADTSKTQMEVELGQKVETKKTQSTGREVKTTTTTKTEEVHRVQILDPAVGTATFLNEAIKHIRQRFSGQEGRWAGYVESDLLPRLHGFELMMAPYTIAHLKLGMTLQQTGVEDISQRLGVYLTNSLEEGIPQQPNFLPMLGLAEAITEEARHAAHIKSERPIMVVMGNPPYSGVSSNETDYANNLVKNYKVEPGGQQKLQERKHWLNDDYVKFIAFAEDMIARNGEGVVAMITNHGYLDNPTFRGMRWHLAKTFDKIYVLDLHGNSKKKEVAPDGSKDENVFNIQQGVAIMLGIKTGEQSESELAEVYHADIYGKRAEKFDALAEDVSWQQLQLDEKMLYFVPKDIEGQAEYEQGIKIDELFSLHTTGIVTMGDKFIVADDPVILRERIEKLTRGEYTEADLNSEFGLGKNYAKWVLGNSDKIEFDESKIVPLAYRPFDWKYTYFDNKLVWRPRTKVMKNFAEKDTIGLITSRTVLGSMQWKDIFVTNSIAEFGIMATRIGNAAPVMPLYIYEGIEYE